MMDNPAPTLPSPPYPKHDAVVVNSLVMEWVGHFERGELSVAGALLGAVHMAWGLGHQEGEHLCQGCTHRSMALPNRAFPHPACLLLTMDVIQNSMRTYVDTLVTLLRQGTMQYPQTEEDVRQAFRGFEHTVSALRMLFEKSGREVKG